MGLRCGTNTPDCSLYKQGHGCGKFQADSDIAGIGVIVAIISTSLVNLTIGFISHAWGILRGYDHNAIDGWIFGKLRSLRVLHIGDDRKQFWRAVSERMVLLISDYQLLFGIAILVAGILKRCTISAYHFSLVVDLAWFSNTHMTSLSVLRSYLRERPALRNWRVGIVTVIMSLLLIAISLASVPRWNANFSCPAQCLFVEKERNMSLTYPYFGAIVLHYATSLWRVYDTPRFDRFFLNRPHGKLQKIVRNSKRTNSNDSAITNRRLDNLQTAAAMSVATSWLSALAIRFYFAVAAILGSLTVSLYYDLIWFSVGLFGILETRRVPGGLMDGDENKLSFGQIVPMLLLGSILLTFKEVYTEQKFKSSAEGALHSSSTEERATHDVEMLSVRATVQPVPEDSEIGHPVSTASMRLPIQKPT